MPQDQSTGAEANDYGRRTARAIAAALGAKLNGTRSNEATRNGARVVIKCARSGTTSVGVTYEMQKSLQYVFAAFEMAPATGKYEVFSLPLEIFIKNQRPSRSKGNSAHKVGLVSRSVFITHGTLVNTVHAATDGDA